MLEPGCLPTIKPLRSAYSWARRTRSIRLMSARNHKSPGHSAEVRLELHVNGHVLRLAQLGSDFVIVADPVNHPQVEAEIAMSIDGHESRWPVPLHEGLSAARRPTRLSRGPL